MQLPYLLMKKYGWEARIIAHQAPRTQESAAPAIRAVVQQDSLGFPLGQVVSLHGLLFVVELTVLLVCDDASELAFA
jgi:ABC-type iron transport system FetAB permease component